MSLQAIAIASASKRYAAMSHVEVTTPALSKFSDNVSCKSAVFRCYQTLKKDRDYLHFDSGR